jgi:hypothetical protein
MACPLIRIRFLVGGGLSWAGKNSFAPWLQGNSCGDRSPISLCSGLALLWRLQLNVQAIVPLMETVIVA